MAEGDEDKIKKTDLLPDQKAAQKQAQKEEQSIERLQAKLYQQNLENERLKKDLEAALEEKRKPGITQVNEEGEQLRKKRPNTNRWGLTSLVLPPYTKGRVAIYKACDGDEGKNPATGLPVEPVDCLIPGQYTFFDRFETDPFKKDKVIQNITGSSTVIEDGKPVVRENMEDVILERGYKWVDVASDYPLYVFMELHPNNKSNKFRPSNAPKIFERVDINTKGLASQSASVDLALDAGNAVRDMKKDEVIAYAAETGCISTSVGRMPGEIKHDLKVWAMANPTLFFRMNKDAKATIQMVVLDAIQFGLIGYRKDKFSYVNLETDEIISTHTASEDPMDQLVKFLAKEGKGKEWYAHIQERLNYWNSDDRP